jgi:hypothetical protein
LHRIPDGSGEAQPLKGQSGIADQRDDSRAQIVDYNGR